jgi:putative alpha-1,2-mannosidase
MQRYLARSKQWENLWNPDMVSNLTVGTFKGFLTPRDADGKFNLTGIDGVSVFNATDCGVCEANSDTYEATAWEYSMNVPVSIDISSDYSCFALHWVNMRYMFAA